MRNDLRGKAKKALAKETIAKRALLRMVPLKRGMTQVMIDYLVNHYKVRT